MAVLGALGIRTDPILSHNFVISLLDTSNLAKSIVLSAVFDVALGGFSECSGIEMTMDVEEYREGGRNSELLKFPTRITWSNITLKKGIGAGTGLWDWFYGFMQGQGKRKDGIIVLMTEFNGVPVPNNIWYFQRGLPLKYTGPTMIAAQSNVAIESIEISHEGIYQVQNQGFGPGVMPAAAKTVLNLGG